VIGSSFGGASSTAVFGAKRSFLCSEDPASAIFDLISTGLLDVLMKMDELKLENHDPRLFSVGGFSAASQSQSASIKLLTSNIIKIKRKGTIVTQYRSRISIVS
jgi:hypothetical protein